VLKAGHKDLLKLNAQTFGEEFLPNRRGTTWGWAMSLELTIFVAAYSMIRLKFTEAITNIAKLKSTITSRSKPRLDRFPLTVSPLTASTR